MVQCGIIAIENAGQWLAEVIRGRVRESVNAASEKTLSSSEKERQRPGPAQLLVLRILA